ncbi:hypothetical protein [Marivirga sp.]|uniref:hypothetical protein n=1 Tax=Marivirga sp. TaxID=2018662 RepID=UPI002D7F0F04|nr:hypothetical protein [Marivirga sp.]HET8860030.1 hypothetical protein [Marivirga sp.]
MENFTLIIEILIVLLIIATVAVIIKYPKDIVRGFFGFFEPDLGNLKSWIFLPIWLIGRTIELVTKFKIYENSHADLSEEPYKSTKNMKFDFENGTKYLVTSNGTDKINDIIKDFLGISYANITFDDFVIEQMSPTVVRCPSSIPFYDFNLLIQHSNNELQKTNCYGLFKSDKLSFYCYQDPKTLHNIIGQTHSGQNFSVYTLDDLNKKTYLKINNKIKVKELDMDSEIKGVQHHL